MTTGQQRRLGLLVVLMLMGAVAASTKAQSPLAPYGRDPPNVFDGVLSNVAGSSEISTAQLRAALTDGSAIVLDARLCRNRSRGGNMTFVKNQNNARELV